MYRKLPFSAGWKNSICWPACSAEISHLLAVTTTLALGTLEGSILVGIVLAVPSRDRREDHQDDAAAPSGTSRGMDRAGSGHRLPKPEGEPLPKILYGAKTDAAVRADQSLTETGHPNSASHRRR